MIRLPCAGSETAQLHTCCSQTPKEKKHNLNMKDNDDEARLASLSLGQPSIKRGVRVDQVIE